MGLKEWVIPQDRFFYDLLEAESTKILEGAVRLEDAVKSFGNMEERRKEFKDLEHNTDEIVHQIYEKVNRSFITPIDQDDLTRLASLYDDVLDFMYAIMNKIVLYEVSGPTEAMLNFAGIIRQSVEQLHSAVHSMRKHDKAEMDKRCIEVDRLENEADSLLNESVAALFKTGDTITIFKLKEIYEFMETVTDRCEDVSLVLRDVMLSA
jgi:predicted phosphate transport protein (TIGR00153 family)